MPSVPSAREYGMLRRIYIYIYTLLYSPYPGIPRTHTIPGTLHVIYTRQCGTHQPGTCENLVHIGPRCRRSLVRTPRSSNGLIRCWPWRALLYMHTTGRLPFPPTMPCPCPCVQSSRTGMTPRAPMAVGRPLHGPPQHCSTAALQGEGAG